MIWDKTTEIINGGMSARSLMKQSNVAVSCTTDDPVDSLEHHKLIRDDKSFAVKVLPAWRPDKSRKAEDPVAYNHYLDLLGEAADITI